MFQIEPTGCGQFTVNFMFCLKDSVFLHGVNWVHIDSITLLHLCYLQPSLFAVLQSHPPRSFSICVSVTMLCQLYLMAWSKKYVVYMIPLLSPSLLLRYQDVFSH